MPFGDGTGPRSDARAVDWTALDGGGASELLAPPPLPPLDESFPPHAAMTSTELTASGTRTTRDIFMPLPSGLYRGGVPAPRRLPAGPGRPAVLHLPGDRGATRPRPPCDQTTTDNASVSLRI